MELCDLTLHDYIHPETPSNLPQSIPCFVRGGSWHSVFQIWTVISDIASGVEYVHDKGHVHRDIKPRNGISLISPTEILVLYSCKDSSWKLADFGLTCEGSSQMEHTTRYGIGTGGYRAPELMSYDKKTYTNRVDVWSMGCILYELATGSRAFRDDGAVFHYLYSGKMMEVALDDTFDPDFITATTKNIIDMLQIESSARPSASVLSKEFKRQWQFAENNVQLSIVTNSGTLLAVTGETEQTPATPQQHLEVVTNEAEESTPALPSHLIGVSLYKVAERGDVEGVKSLLNAKADVNAKGEYYGNALQAASSCGREAVVRLLLEKGADVNAQGGRYGHALQAASHCGHEAVVRMLLEKGAYVNAQGGYYGNALQAASLTGYVAVVRVLLENGAYVNALGGHYGHALQAASREGHEAVVRVLLEKGADVNAQGGDYGHALQVASREGNEAVVRVLLEKGADVNALGGYYGNALQAASRKGHEAVVRVLLEKGANVNAPGGHYGNALRAASREAVVRLLLENGADVEYII